MATDAPDLAGLFAPFTLRGVTLTNRIVMPAMGLEACAGGVPGAAVRDHCRDRVLGGTGLLMTEGVYIDHHASGDNPVLGRFHGEDALRAWQGVADAVHAVNGIIMPELWHVGMIYRTSDLMDGEAVSYRPELRQLSPSGYIAPGKRVAEPMRESDFAEVIEAYGVGAENAMRLGFDGVEIHAGHGYLIDQFFWKALNHRTDRYGGSPANRGRLGAEVVAEVRRRVGPDVPVIMRISQWKLVDYGAAIADTPQELEALLAPIVDAGVDLFDCSQRRFWEPTFTGSDLNLAGWTKRVTGLPTMTVGSVGLDQDMVQSFVDGGEARCDMASLHELARRFDRGDFDLVGVGRAMIANADWGNRVRRGEYDALRPYDHRMLAHLREALNAARADETD